MKSSVIQIIVVGIFILFGIAGVIIFSTSSTRTNDTSQNVKVVVWGVLPEDNIMTAIEEINTEAPGTISLTYIYKPERQLEADLTSALLDRENVPDGLLLSHEDLLKYQKRLTLIAWSALSERDLKNSYSEAGEIFFTPEGTYAIPFLIDPLVLYWNRDIFNSQAIPRPPQRWEEVVDLANTLTERNENRTIKRTTIALGEYQNIPHAKAILSALSGQVGGRFVSREEDYFVSDVQVIPPGTTDNPLATALSFYTQFADPSSSIFSWSRALPPALYMFLSSDSALYIGFGSEADEIRSKNPNLNFDIAHLPQAKSAGDIKSTYGTVYGIALVNESPYKDAMLNAALLLTSPLFQTKFAQLNNMAPVRRELLSTPPGTGIAGTIWQSAFWTKAWLDPNPSITSAFFRNMIESVTSGENKVPEAVVSFGDELKEILDVYRK